MIKYQRMLARITLPFVVLFLGLLPSQAYALVAPPAQLAAYGLPSSGAAATASNGAAAAAAAGAIDLFAAVGLVAVGASISYFGIDYLVGDQYEVIRAPLTTASPVPTPSAPSTAIPTESVEISSRSFSLNPTGMANGSGITWADAISSYNATYHWCSASPPDSGTFDIREHVATIGCDAGVCGNACGAAEITVYSFVNLGAPVITCGAGYILSGTSCVLDNARQATPDKACDLARSGSALAMLSDADCAGSGTAIDEICNSPGTVCQGVEFKTSGVGPLGQPRHLVVTPAADGGSQIQAKQQRSIGTQTVVDTTTIQVAPDGKVTGISGQTEVGSIPTDGTAPTTGTPVAPTEINFPTDYARTGEAATAAQTVADADTAWRNGEQQRFLDRIGIAPPADIIPSTTYNVEITAVPFASNAVCPMPITFDALGTTYNIGYEPMCDLMQTMRPLFLAMGGFAAAFVFFQGLKA